MKNSLKIAIICILALINVSNLFSQPFRSIFATDTTQWNVMYRFYDPVKKDGFKDTANYQYRNMVTVIHKIYGDTVITTNNYHYFISHNEMYSPNDFNGFIREDTNTGKVWFRRISDLNERLIMDFSLNVGDPFKFISFPFNDTINAHVDSVRYLNGAKQIYFDTTLLFPDGRKFSFMEGIGCNYLPLAYVNYDQMPSSSLLCAYKSGVQTYNCKARKPFNAIGDTCSWFQLWSSVNENDLPANFNIFPNPAINRLNIENIGENDGEAKNIRIFNILGEMLLDMEIHDSFSTINIKLDNFVNGIYLIRILNSSNILYSNKFIISK